MLLKKVERRTWQRGHLAKNTINEIITKNAKLNNEPAQVLLLGSVNPIRQILQTAVFILVLQRQGSTTGSIFRLSKLKSYSCRSIWYKIILMILFPIY